MIALLISTLFINVLHANCLPLYQNAIDRINNPNEVYNNNANALFVGTISSMMATLFGTMVYTMPRGKFKELEVCTGIWSGICALAAGHSLYDNYVSLPNNRKY